MSIESFSGVWDVLQEGLEKGLHTGGQITVIQGGEVLLDEAFGTDGAGGDTCRSDHAFLWMSAGKPVTAIAIAQLVQSGKLSFHTQVAEVIPEFEQAGKAAVTIGHILSHSAAFRGADRIAWSGREATLEQICQLPPDKGQTPRQHGGYHIGGSWFVLGEVVHRCSGLRLEEYLQQEIFAPFGMQQCSLGTPPDGWSNGFIAPHDTYPEKSRIHPALGTKEALRHPLPGRNIMGPIRELARFYEQLRAIMRGDSDLLTAALLEQMVQPQRPVGLRDITFGHPADFGFGFYLQPEKYSPGKATYGYGTHASDRSFGHSGAQSSCGFYDSEADLIVTWVVNGMPGEPRHQRRARAINEAVYQDLVID